MKWERVPLSALCANADDIRCGPFGTQLNKDEFREEGVPLWGIKQVNVGFSIQTKEFLEPKTAKRLSQYELIPGDLVMTRKGTVGNCAVYPSNFETGIMHSDLLRLRIDPKRCNPSFLVYQLHYSQDVSRQLSLISGGAIMPGINVGRLKQLEVIVPPLAEQKRIAAILDAADAVRTKRREALAQLDALLQSTFLTLFGDPVADTQKLPIQPLESLLARPLQNGAYYPKETYAKVGGVEMVHMSDAFYDIVPRGNLKRVNCPEPDIEKYALNVNDILIARRSLTLEGAAKPCLIPQSDEPLIFESSFIRVTPKPEKITALYLYHYLANNRVKQKSVRPYITQSTISGINQSNLEKCPVVVPPLPLQQKFAAIVESVERQKTTQRAHLAELDALFAALQHRAFRGEL